MTSAVYGGPKALNQTKQVPGQASEDLETVHQYLAHFTKAIFFFFMSWFTDPPTQIFAF